MRRNAELMQRAQERRQRSDDAKRLLDVVPDLESLELEICERRKDQPDMEVSHKRYIVVDRAPALFEIPCSDRKCTDGGHDVTTTVMRHLRGHDVRFQGRHVCPGHLRAGDCAYEMRFVASARYVARTRRRSRPPLGSEQAAAR